ncbi:MAG: hypothetical protein VB934_00375, partial [Polyangiaceae bacterium]
MLHRDGQHLAIDRGEAHHNVPMAQTHHVVVEAGRNRLEEIGFEHHIAVRLACDGIALRIRRIRIAVLVVGAVPRLEVGARRRNDVHLMMRLHVRGRIDHDHAAPAAPL